MTKSRLRNLVFGSVLLLTGQAAVGQIVIHSVVTDSLGNQIVVKGNGLDGIAPGTVSLGGVSIPDADFEVVPDGSQLTIDFSFAAASAVPEQGSYLLEVEDAGSTPTRFSAYFDSPIIPPVIPGGCPCEGIWNTYAAGIGATGFGGLTPSCTYGTPGSSQLAVQFYDRRFVNLWVLTTEYDEAGIKDCALEIDEPNVLLTTPEEHNACSSYLATNYFGLGAPECDFFPPLIPHGGL